MRNRIISIALIFFACSSCNSVLNLVIPGTDGINRITLRSTKSSKELMEQAQLTAQVYCKNAKKSVLLLSRQNFSSESLKQQQVFDEGLGSSNGSNETYLEFVCH